MTFTRNELERIVSLIEQEGGTDGESVLYCDYDLYIKIIGVLLDDPTLV